MKEYIRYLLSFIMHSFFFIILLALLSTLLIAITKLSIFIFGNLLLFYIFGIYYIFRAIGHVVASKRDYGKNRSENISTARSILFAVVSSLLILWLMYPGQPRNFIQTIMFMSSDDFSEPDDYNYNYYDDEYSCDNAPYCKEMNSCEEAEFYYFECGLDRLDKDNDGIPCESICN